MSAAARTLPVEPLSAAALAGCGAPLGHAPDAPAAGPSFHSALSDFWHVHEFDPGDGGTPEILWVRYRNSTMVVTALEVHLQTEQAVVPLDGAVIQVVCPTRPDGAPDLDGLRALHVSSGTGVLMSPGCWHTTLVGGDETTCLMLTRASTRPATSWRTCTRAPRRRSRASSRSPTTAGRCAWWAPPRCSRVGREVRRAAAGGRRCPASRRGRGGASRTRPVVLAAPRYRGRDGSSNSGG